MNKKIIWLNRIALIFALEFLFLGWVWAYYANLFIAYPFGILGFILWYYARKREPNNTLNRITGIILLMGLVISVGGIFVYR